jgi:hypothetical protein
MEFDSDETVDHFHNGWWNDFHHAVDQSHDAAADFIKGQPAIAIGILGLDCAHSCGAELHPVYGLAIHLKTDPADDVWAIMVRNWGDEGYCSHGAELFQRDDIRFRLPMPNATDVHFSGGQFWTKKGAPGGGPWLDEIVPNEGVVVGFSLPIPVARQDGGNEDDWSYVYGDLHMTWTVSTPPKGPLAARFNLSHSASDGHEPGQAIINRMTAIQRRVYFQTLAKPARSSAENIQVRLPPEDSSLHRSTARPPAPTPRPLISPYVHGDSADAHLIAALRAANGGKLPTIYKLRPDSARLRYVRPR